jgi:GGDEF domain-containing protein
MTTKFDGVLLKFSVGVGYTLLNAENALWKAKKNKNKDVLYNICISNKKTKEVLFKDKRIITSYNKLKKFLQKNNPSLIKDLENFKYDPKTKLLNKLGYLLELNEINTKERCILFLDVDNLHDINTKYGYSFVDKYLIKVGQELNKNIRQKNRKDFSYDVLNYVSSNNLFHRKNDSAGDEFIINLEYKEKDLKLAKKIAERYLEKIYSAQKKLSKKLNLL